LRTRITNGQTVFLVLRNSSPSGNYHAPLGDTSVVWTYTAEYTRNLWTGNDTAAVLNGATWLNGAPATSSTPYPAATGPLAVLSNVATGPVPTAFVGIANNAASFPWSGDIAEVLVYDHALSSSDDKEVATYLARRYKIVSSFLPW